MSKTVPAFIIAAATAVVLTAARASVSAIDVPEPCDFITGGGFVLTNTLSKANFGAHGGCKHRSFWGNLNYVDHGGHAGVSPYHVKSTDITGYFGDLPNARTICGVARTNAGETLTFRVRMQDNEDLFIQDMFEIQLSNGYLVTTRALEGGSIKLHKPNPSTSGPIVPPDAATICPGLDNGNGDPPE